MIKRISIICFLLLIAVPSLAWCDWIPDNNEEKVTFEMRYFTHDTKADGITDFHGETEWLTTGQRVEMLNRYADYASQIWGDPELNTPLFSEEQVKEQLARIKPQPTTTVRQTIPLREWRAYGYKTGKETDVANRWHLWIANGACIQEGCLILDGTSASPTIEPIAWRFRMKGTLVGKTSGLHVTLKGKDNTAMDVVIGQSEDFEIYGDLPNRRVFLSSIGQTVKELDIPEVFGDTITSFSIGAEQGNASLEHFSFYNFVPQFEVKSTPYRMELLYDEDFQSVPIMEGWQRGGYNDTGWKQVTLPSPHGCLNESGESYYLRTKVQVGNFKTAILKMETLDPEGEVWVNGEPAAVLQGRMPRNIDIGEYLLPNRENTIAVRVKPYYAHHAMQHTPNDHNIGWFLGRTSLILNQETCHIAEVLTHTATLIENEAVQHHCLTIRNSSISSRKANIEVNYYPWFPEERERVVTVSRQIELRPQDNTFEVDVKIENPQLWTTSTPCLYRVEVILKNDAGEPIDDYVTTTGIRLIEQKMGVLYINHHPEMLNGGQNMGFRPPLEYMSQTVRCATNEMIMRELMMVLAMNGNLLRIHVHAEAGVTEGLNDPRFAEYADQMGLYLIWPTAAWIREGEAWNVDIANYPLYIRSVYNHPSIVLWEASNHPNRFKQHDATDTQDYFEHIIRSILSADSTRLISPTSFWQHSHYANYDGTKDYNGNDLKPNPLLMHRMMTRGNQDAYSGYSNDWSQVRKIPCEWARQCLEAKDLCYFNFEHEESIGQPNWNLARKEPWFEVKSYEWDYSIGNIGREFETSEWRASQAYQAFGAWESMKMQTLAGVSGYSWCTMESGANMVTYLKPLIDPFFVPKLAFYANKMAFQRLWAGSDNVDTVYGPGDSIRPVIFNMGDACVITLTIELQNEKGKTLEKKTIKNITVPEGRSVTRLDEFRFRHTSEGCHFIKYKIKMYECMTNTAGNN